MTLTIGSLCSGSGIMDTVVAEHFGARVIWHCEKDEDASLVLKHHHPDVPNHGDLTAVDWATVTRPDILAMGVPCQPVSSAGRQRGDDDERWLWPYAHDAILTLRPQWIVFENVRNLISIKEGTLWRAILADMRAAGYRVRWLTVGACAVGMPHHRHRVFALAERVGADAPEPVRLNVAQCGVPRGARGRDLIPSPRASDGRSGAGHTNNAEGSPNLRTVAALLPTPSAVSYGSNRGGAAGRVGPDRPSLETLARITLLPTPQARDGEGRGEGDAAYWERVGKVPSNVGAAVTLLPSPRASDGVNGGPNQRGRKGDLAMPSAVQPERWGQFAGAVDRWSQIFGAPPEPTEPNRNGAPRLAAAFAEWMMGWPAGHVADLRLVDTDPRPFHLSRNAALRIIGNGVAPHQLAHALVLLSDNNATTTDWGTMADNDIVKEINERMAARAQRVLDAAHAVEGRDDPHVYVGVEIAGALEELAACWREEAELWRESKKRGWQSTATNLRTAATYVAAVALDVRKLESTPEPTVETHAESTIVIGTPTASHVVEAEPGEDDVPAPGDVVLTMLNGETHAGVVQPDGSYQLERLEATAAYLAGRTDDLNSLAPPCCGTTGVEHLSHCPLRVPPVSGSALADEVKADQMTNPTPSPRALLDPATYVPISLGPRWTFEDLMSAPVGPPTNADGTPLEHWSWSQLETSEDCGLRYRFRKVERLPEVPQWALIGGRTFHACVEGIELGTLGFTIDTGTDLAQVWTTTFAREIADQASKTTLPPDRWRASNKGAEGWTWWNEAGPDMLKRYMDWRHASDRARAEMQHLTIAGKPVIEYETEFVLPGGVRIKLVIDAAYVQQDGSILIVDYKSGKGAGDTSQLGLYAHALVQLLVGQLATVPAIFGTIYDARKGEASRPVDLLAAHPLSEYVYRVHAAESKRRAGIYAPRKSLFCNGCSVQYACPLFAERDS